MNCIAPRLETERLILREFRFEDFEPCLAMVANPRVAEHLGGPTLARDVAWDKFARNAGFWALFGYGLWVVEEKGTGRVAGNVGYGRFERGIGLPDVPEGAWVLDEWAHGQGIGGEAMAAATTWADANLPDTGYVCIIAPENAPSLALAAKLGFAEFRREGYKGAETVVLERPPHGQGA